MNEKSPNIILIGMPGSGKSTVGVILAKLIGRDFVDTDVLIQKEQGRTLQDIVDRDGYLALRVIEEKTILKLECRGHIIATGGSAVAALDFLAEQGARRIRLVSLVSAPEGIARAPVEERDLAAFVEAGLAQHVDDVAFLGAVEGETRLRRRCQVGRAAQELGHHGHQPLQDLLGGLPRGDLGSLGDEAPLQPRDGGLV